MPPRYAYWTILIDDKPTAFRARDREELVPTLQQLKRTNPNIVMRWFARGKLWDSPEQERWAQRNPPRREARGRDWRPGGAHQDPRARFRDAEKKRREAKRQRHHAAQMRRRPGPAAPPQTFTESRGNMKRPPSARGGPRPPRDKRVNKSYADRKRRPLGNRPKSRLPGGVATRPDRPPRRRESASRSVPSTPPTPKPAAPVADNVAAKPEPPEHD